MSALQAVVLGLLQGVTEFIPVSSSGHLVLVPWLLGWRDPGLTYDLVVHLGTLFALFLYFRRDIQCLLMSVWAVLRPTRHKRPTGATPESRLALLILISSLPGALLGYLLEDQFEGLFASPRTVSLLLMVTGMLLMVGERLGKRQTPLAGIRLKEALAIGLAQGCAIAPGVSRSGATIATGLVCGLEREAATRFSFLMSLAIVLGASVFRIVDVARAGYLAAQGAELALGFLSAAASGYVALGFLLAHVRSHSLRPFAWYCWGLGTVAFGLSWVR